MNKYLSKENKNELNNFIKNLNFEDRRIFNEIENKHYGKILYTKNKKLISYTSLPFVLEKRKVQFDYLDLLWFDKCKKCKNTTKRTNVPYGCLQPEIFVIGIAPGHGNLKVGYKQKGYNTRAMSFGFVADYIKHALIELNLHYKTWYTNIIKCSLPDNRKPFRIEVENCYHWLRKELHILKPKIIILLGNDAYNNFKWKNHSNVYKIYHPSYYIRFGKSPNSYYKHVKEVLDA